MKSSALQAIVEIERSARDERGTLRIDDNAHRIEFAYNIVVCDL
jgi:hypothetical protein